MTLQPGKSRGYTLIEIVLVLGLLGIVLSTIGLMVRQGYQLHYVQLDRLEAHQNGRTALEFIKSSLRKTAWGASNGLNHRGTIVVGGCFDDSLADSKDCNNVDDGSDRIRVYRGLADPHFFRQQQDPNEVASSQIRVSKLDSVAEEYLEGKLGLISGKCLETPYVGTSAVVITSASNGVYSYKPFGGGNTQLACPGGFTDFSFGAAEAVDFFIDRTDEARGPVLMMRRYEKELGSDDAESAGLEVAGGIENLQIQYGIDSSEPVDNIVDRWCNDPFAVLGECSLALSEEESLARIIAARVEIVARNVRKRTSMVGNLRKEIRSQDSEPIEVDDGYQRYIYRATVALRNKRL